MAMQRTIVRGALCALRDNMPRNAIQHRPIIIFPKAMCTAVPASRSRISNYGSAKGDSYLPPSIIYSYDEIKGFAESPTSERILIDVREPSELKSTGTIPNATNIPIDSVPDYLCHPPSDSKSMDKELVFFCKAGIRSKQAADFAKGVGWKQVAEYPGSWLDWSKNGGRVQKK